MSVSVPSRALSVLLLFAQDAQSILDGRLRERVRDALAELAAALSEQVRPRVDAPAAAGPAPASGREGSMSEHCWHMRGGTSGGDGRSAVYRETCCHCGTKRTRNVQFGAHDPVHGPHVVEPRRTTTQVRGGRGPCIWCAKPAT